MRHVWNKGEPAHIVEEDLVKVRSAACRESPHNILSVVDINVVAAEDQPVDGVAGLAVKDQVADLLGEFFRGGLHFPQLCGVDSQSDPGHLGLEWREGVSYRESSLLTDLADLGSGQ